MSDVTLNGAPAAAPAKVETPFRRFVSEFCESKVAVFGALVFFVIALIAAVFGFGGIAAGAVGIAKTLFFVFLILAVVSFIFNSAGGKG